MTIQESVVGTIPLFGALSVQSRAWLLQHAMLHKVAAGTVLFEQGEVPNFQHLVVSGSVQLFGRSDGDREVLIEVVEPPDLIIPAAVVMDLPYLMQARVPEPSQLLLISAAIFRTTVATDPALALQVVGSLSHQFRRMVRQIKNLKLRSATERVGCYILALSERQGTQDRAVLPYGKNLIASELGITRESFSRALSGLQTSGIRVQADTIVITDRGRLVEASNPDPLIDGPDLQA